jgi:hypothetical protein
LFHPKLYSFTFNMRLNHAVLLLAGTLSQALPAPSPQDDSTLPTEASTNINTATDQLAQLAEFAQEVVNSTFVDANGNAKRGTCTLQNLAIRREWYVLPACAYCGFVMPFLPKILLSLPSLESTVMGLHLRRQESRMS